MKISNYELNISREEAAAYYELKVKHEERKAVVVITLIMFAIFFLAPIMLTRTILDLIGAPDMTVQLAENLSIWMLEILIIQGLVILILVLMLTSNAYRCGKLFHTLRKARDFDTMLCYVEKLGEDDPWIHIAYILHFKQFLFAGVTEENELAIIYDDDGRKSAYTTFSFKLLCNEGCQDPVLVLNSNGIQVIDRWERLEREI